MDTALVKPPALPPVASAPESLVTAAMDLPSPVERRLTAAAAVFPAGERCTRSPSMAAGVAAAPAPDRGDTARGPPAAVRPPPPRAAEVPAVSTAAPARPARAACSVAVADPLSTSSVAMDVVGDGRLRADAGATAWRSERATAAGSLVPPRAESTWPRHLASACRCAASPTLTAMMRTASGAGPGSDDGSVDEYSSSAPADVPRSTAVVAIGGSDRPPSTPPPVRAASVNRCAAINSSSVAAYDSHVLDAAAASRGAERVLVSREVRGASTIPASEQLQARTPASALTHTSNARTSRRSLVTLGRRMAKASEDSRTTPAAWCSACTRRGGASTPASAGPLLKAGSP